MAAVSCPVSRKPRAHGCGVRGHKPLGSSHRPPCSRNSGALASVRCLFFPFAAEDVAVGSRFFSSFVGRRRCGCGFPRPVGFKGKRLGPGSKPTVPFWGRCTTHFRTYSSGDWDVHWGYGILTHGLVCCFPLLVLKGSDFTTGNSFSCCPVDWFFSWHSELGEGPYCSIQVLPIKKGRPPKKKMANLHHDHCSVVQWLPFSFFVVLFFWWWLPH